MTATLCPFDHGARRLAVLAVAAAVIAYLVGGAALGNDRSTAVRALEHPGLAAPVGGTGAGDAGETAGIDVADVVDSVHHRMVAGRPGTLVTEDEDYRASFDARGFTVAPRGDATGGLLVSTTELSRGSTPIDLAAGPWRESGNVARRSLGAGIVEQVTATGGRLEWDVVLDSPPAGSGALRIDADVTGSAREPRRDRGAWHWELGDDERMVMGDLVVKDRTGAELYRAVPEARRSRVSLIVPASVLRAALYPLTVDPVISPAHPVSSPVPSKAVGRQDASAVAFDGTNYLVVWQDARSGTSTDVYGSRVSKAGTVLDSTGIAISVAVGEQSAPVVAFDGTNYLVVWQNAHPFGEYEVYRTRVSTAGIVLDPGGIAISPATGDQSQSAPAVAFDGTNSLVTWSTWSPATGFGISGARVNRAGTVLDGAALSIATLSAGAGDGRKSGPAVAFDGTNFLVVWSDARAGAGRDIYGARVSRAGTVLDGAGLRISQVVASDESAPAVAFDGTNYLVVWQDASIGIAGARVTRAGTVLDQVGIPISGSSGQVSPDVGFDGTNYLVVWTWTVFGSPGVVGARVSTNGTVLAGPGLIPNAAGNYDPTVAFDGTNFLVVRTSPGPDGPDSDIYGFRVTRAGAVLDSAGTLVSTTANAQTIPAVAFDGTNHLVVWSDLRSGSATQGDIYAARVGAAGALLDGAGIRISAAVSLQSAPAVAFDGSNFLVVWSDLRSGTRAIYGARVSRVGAVLDAAGIRIAAGSYQSPPALAFDGTNFLVVWFDIRVTPDWSVIWTVDGTRVSKAGAVLDAAGIPIASGIGLTGYDQTTPAVASDGTNSLVTWPENHSGVGWDIRAARVSRAGAVLDPTGITISAATGDQTTPAVAFDGTSYLVVWRDARAGASTNGITADIYGARVSRAGTVLDGSGRAISTAPGTQDEPAVVANGSFLVVWRDERSGGESSDIYATRVNGAGGVVDGAGVAIATNGGRAAAPAAAVGPGATFGVVYERFAPDPPYGSVRVFHQTIAPK